MRVRSVAPLELSARDVDRWTSLAERAVEPNPFFEPDFVLPAVEHLAEPQVLLLVVEDDERWRACLPVQRVRHAGLMQAVRTWCHRYCFLGTPLVDPEAPAPAASALLRHALGRGAPPLVLERQRTDGPVWEALQAAAADLRLDTVFASSHERALLCRQSTGDYVETLSGRQRRDLVRLARRLEEEVGGEVTVTDEAGDDAALDAFIELERSGWKGREGTAIASDPRDASFFRKVGRSFAARGRLELLTLRAGERRAAMVCNLYSGEGGFCFKVAHDEELRRFSPGVQLERASMRLFQEQRTERWQDSCADPENSMMNRLWPGRRPIATTVLSRRGLQASISRGGVRLARSRRANQRSTSSAHS